MGYFPMVHTQTLLFLAIFLTLSPFVWSQTTITLGNGAQTSTTQSPLNLTSPSLRSQFVYQAADILAAGGFASDITALGFNVAAAPLQGLQNFTIKIKHTGADDVTTHDPGPFQTVLTLANYSPTAGGFDLLTLDSTFSWNGIDNLLIETCFYTPTGFGQGGQIQVDPTLSNSFRYITSASDLCQAGVQTTISSVNLPQIQLTFSGTASLPSIGFSPDSLVLSTLLCDDMLDTSILVSNTGTAPLNWTLGTPITITDDFENGFVSPEVWESVSSGQVSGGCGSSNGSLALYFDGSPVRQAVTVPFTALAGDQVSFALRFGTGSGLCENADGGEDVVLEYSVAGGAWQSYRIYDTEIYTSFTTIVEPIPVLGQSIRLRWRQVTFTAAGLDNWAIDEVKIPGGFNAFTVASPDSGVVSPGASQLIDLDFDLTGLENGNYNFNLFLASNDPTNPLISIPVNIAITGPAELQFLDSCVLFDTVTQFTSATQSFLIRNTGCGSLTINNITSTDLAFSVPNFTPVTISTGDSVSYVVNFAPTIEQPYAASLIVNSNLGTDSLCILGVGGGAPVAQLLPDSLSVTLTGCDDATTLPLQIINAGTGSLSWTYASVGNSISLVDSSLIFYNLSGASTFHTFSGLNPQVDSLQLTIILSGDFDATSEYADLIIEGTFIQQIPDNNPNNGTDIVFSITIGGAQLAAWLADNQLVVQVANSGAVDTNLGGLDAHRVTLGQRSSSWLTAIPSSGVTAAGDTTVIQVQINGIGLNSGTYLSSSCLNSNDPINPQVCIPVDLTVIGDPVLNLSDSCAVIDSIQQFTTGSDTVWLLNTGCDSLVVAGLTVSDTIFSVQTNNLAVAVGDSIPLVITFSPIDTGQYTAVLDILNNAGDTTLCLKGFSIGTPIISVTPDSLSATITGCDDSTFLSLQLGNLGLGSLQFLTSGSSGDSSVLIIQDTDTWGLFMNTFLQNQFGLTTTTITSSQISTTNFNDYDLIITVGDESSFYYNNISSFQSKFEDFLLNGGIVQYQVATQGANVNLAGSVVALNGNRELRNVVQAPGHPSVNGLPTILQGNSANHTYFGQLLPGTLIITSTESSNSPTTIEYAYGSGKVIATGMTLGFLFNSGVYASTSGQVLPQMTAYSLSLLNSLPNWAQLNPDSGTVAVMDSFLVQVGFYSAGLNSGFYQGDITLLTNDPVNPQVSIPVSLIVNGVPEISLPDSCLDFPLTMQFTEVKDSIWIRNTGCDTLVVSDVTGGGDAFNADTVAFSIAPGDSIQVPITFSPDTVGIYVDTLTFVSNAGDSTLCVTGSTFGAPAAVVSPSSLNITLPGCADSLTVPLAIQNQGQSDLIWEIIGNQGFDSTSFQNFSVSGQATTHLFSDLPTFSDSLIIVVTIAGDFDGTSELATISVEGSAPIT
ncbi:MAG: choice-of-anchor D domain-containing protein, partial [Bacteroidota bacterium]